MSSEVINYEVTPRQARKFIARIIEAGLVPFLHGSPGIGKSSIMRAVADEYGLEVIDHRLSTSAPEDLSGLPNFDDRGFARFYPFAELFPIEGISQVPEGKQGWMVFLDEFNAANKSVQAAAYKLVLDKLVGQHRLHERVILTAAGNLATDRSIVNSLSTAMQSRLVHLTLKVDYDDWLRDVAYPNEYDQRIIGFLSWKSDYLMDFRPDHNDKTFCCPRTWEFMNRLTKGRDIVSEDAPLYGGTITSGKAVEFVNYIKFYEQIPKLPDILKDPLGTFVPSEPPIRYATVTFLQEKVTDGDFDAITKYVNRMSSEFRVLFFRGLMIRKPEMRAHPAFRAAMVELAKYFYDD